MKFTGCKYLDFKTEYTAKKEVIANGNQPKVFWLRKVPDPSCPSMVQFCSQRGRLNHPDACICLEKAMCNDYIEVEHNVPDEEIT
jgi:hypothetical protein